jgi:hypothetical protein
MRKVCSRLKADSRNQHRVENIEVIIALVNYDRSSFFGRNEDKVTPHDRNAPAIADVKRERPKRGRYDAFFQFVSRHGLILSFWGVPW